MEKLPMCRICLAENVRMYVVVNKNLHELYERLTDNPFITKDNRPMLACFFCCTKLKQCCRFQRKCLESEELFAQMMNEDYELKPLIKQNHLECFNGLIQSRMVHVSVVDQHQTESDDIQEELPAVCERPEDIIEPKVEHQSDELELENLNNIYSEIEDMPAQQSDSDLEDDLPLMEIKTEVDEEQEVWRKGRASDTQQLELENLNNIYSEIEDMPAQHSDSDLEDDLPLMEIKTEVDEEQEQCSDMQQLELENLNNIYSDIEDMPAQQFDSDLEDDLPLMEIKTEVDEEQEQCNDTQQNYLSHNPRTKKYQCNICKQIFDQLSAFKLHVISSHRLSVSRNLKYMCSECGKNLKTHEKFVQHCLGHGDPELECNKCHKVFASKFTLRNHRKIHSRQFSCSYCSRTFGTVQELHAHTSKFHVPSEKQNIIMQEEDEHNIQSHDSVIAKVVSNNIFQTNSQTNKKQRQSNKSCEVCLKKFDRIGDLKRHLIEHVIRSTLAKIPVNKYGILNIRCEICQKKVFTKIDKYKAHLREHAELTIYKCTLCDKSFSDSSNFCKHKKVHGATYFQCDMCRRKFSSKKMLIQHMEYHNKTRPIQCPYCDKVFHFESMLNKHLNCSHTKETRKKYSCRFCRQFSSSLKEKWDHEWIVHNVRKVILDCLICGSRFRKYSELKRHCTKEHDTSIPPAKRSKKSKLKMVDEDQNMAGLSIIVID